MAARWCSTLQSVLLVAAVLVKHGRSQVLPTPTLLIDPVQLINFSAENTCPAAGAPGMEETFQLPGDATIRTCNATSNLPLNADTDTGTNTFWKSANNAGGNSLTAELIVPFVMNFVQITFASPVPSALVLSGEFSQPGIFTPFMRVVTEESQCQSLFGVNPSSTVRTDLSNVAEPFCLTFADVNPSGAMTIELRLFDERTILQNGQLLNPRANPPVIAFFSASRIRLNFVGFSNPTFPYVAVAQLQAGAHCICNGHAVMCGLLPGGNYLCDCQADRFTQGMQCEECQPLYNQQLFREDRPCEQCQCYGHATACTYDPSVVGRSVNITGAISGGGLCTNCQGLTAGVNCEQCIPQFYHPSGLPVDLTVDCIACNCNTAGQTLESGNCTDGTGVCINCKSFVVGDKCEACQNNFFNLTATNPNGCEPCNCFEPGTTSGQACNMVTGQCNCKTNVNGRTCDTCDATFFNLTSSNVDGCSPCACNVPGSVNNICNVIDGQCLCNSASVTGRQCDQCIPTTFNHPACIDCGCFLDGQTGRTNLCNSVTGVCTTCKENVDPSNKCEVCRDEFYELLESDPQGCKPCACNPDGTVGASNVCDKTSGACPCKANVIGRQCDMCADNFTMFNSDAVNGCSPCGCSAPGSTSPVCDKSTGICDCISNVVGDKCTQCAPMFHTFPGCTPCDCVVAGQLGAPGICVQETISPMLVAGFCGPCKANIDVGAQRCERCNPTSFNLLASNPDGCTPCECFEPGTNGLDVTCDATTGQCNCKANTNATRQCNECNDRSFNLQGSNTEGCTPCDCDPTGSNNFVCDKVSGQCDCISSRTTRTCNQCTIDRFRFPTCELCNCNEFGRLAVSCADPDGQCSCNATTGGLKCGVCADDHYGQVGVGPGCQPCQCVVDGTVGRSVSCSMVGTCTCLPGVAEPKCGQCQPTHFNFQNNVGCDPCNCVLAGQQNIANGLCNAATGVCTLCKDNVQGTRCEECQDEFFNLQDANSAGCEPCGCFPPGTGGNNVCNKLSVLGECTCLANVMGTKCDTCRPGSFNLQAGTIGGCEDCGCDPRGRMDNICNDVTGVCSCLPGFAGDKCTQCAPGFFGFPNCQECACSLVGTVAMSPVCNVVNGQCDCLSTHSARQCDECAPDHFGMPISPNPALQCRPCGCNQFGSVNTTCDSLTGQCLCVATTRGVTCDMCQPRHFNLTSSNDGTNTFGGGCLRCDQCTDDLLDRACVQETVVINATLRINSTEIQSLIASSEALPGLEDRYRVLRMQTNEWRARQIDQIIRLEILRNIETGILTNISILIARVISLEAVSLNVSSIAAVEGNRINAIARNIEIISERINDLSFTLLTELARLRQTRNDSQMTVEMAQSVLLISFAEEARTVAYALMNATRVGAVSATQLERAMGNYNTTQALLDRITALLATIQADVLHAQNVVTMANGIPPDSATEDYLREAQRLYQTAVAGRAGYMQSIALTNNANNAANNALDATQPPLDMVVSALETLSTYVPQLTTELNTIWRELSENTAATTLYQVITAEALVAARQAYAYEIETLYNSTQPHAADAAEAIIDYQTAGDDVDSATALLQDSESALAMAAMAAGNVAITQASVEQVSTEAHALRETATTLLAYVSSAFTDGSAQLNAQAQRAANATQGLESELLSCVPLFTMITDNFNSISTVAGNIAALGECATNFTTDLLPRVYQAEVDVTSAEPAAAASVTGAAQANAALPGLEARRVAMGYEVANVTGGLALLQAASAQTTQSLDDLLARLQFLRTRLTVAQGVYEVARNCCDSIAPDVCPNNEPSVARLVTTTSFLQFNPGHSNAEPFDFNGDFIDLAFRTLESQGVLLYYSNQDHSQFFGVELRYGHTLIIRAQRAGGDTGVVTVVADNGVFNDDSFHEIRVVILSSVMLVGVDGGLFIFGSFTSEGIYTITNAPLYIGGTPPGVAAQGLFQSGETSRPALIGCIRGVIYNQITLDVLRPSFVGGWSPCNCTLVPPPPMITTTMPTTTTPTMTPTLAPCMNVTPAVLGQGIRLNGGLASETYLQFARPASAAAPLNFQEGALLTIIFRTYIRDGVLMYIANGDHSHVIALEIRNGYINAVVRGGGSASLRVELSSVFVSDGNQHSVDLAASPIGGNQGIVILLVDEMNNPANSLQFVDVIGDAFDFGAASNLYVGGAPSPQALLVDAETTRPAFDGCILSVIQQNVVLDTSSYAIALNTGPCFSQPINGLRIPGFGYAAFVPVAPGSTPLELSLTFRSSSRGTYLTHAGSLASGSVTLYITPLGMVNARVTAMDLSSISLSASPPSTTSSICNGEFIQVTLTIGTTFVSLTVGGGGRVNMEFDSQAAGFAPAGPVIIGQPPAAVIARDNLPALAGFRGCVSSITVNNNALDIAQTVRTDVGLGCGLP